MQVGTLGSQGDRVMRADRKNTVSQLRAVGLGASVALLCLGMSVGGASARSFDGADAGQPETIKVVKAALDQELAHVAQVGGGNDLLRKRRRAGSGDGNGTGGGGGNGNRNQPDLSTLFDQQLRKQQQTNYETQSTTQENNEEKQAEADPLAGIRELARRQEALSRQQKDLAKNQQQLGAEEAFTIGLLNKVVAEGELDKAVSDMAAAIAENAPLTIALVKASAREITRPDGEPDHAKLKRMSDACFSSADFKEGRTAFMEKRKPKFQGM